MGVNYDQKAEVSELYQLEKNITVCGISQEEMEKLYTNRMVKKEAPGRHIYEGIKESAPHNICPLCSLRTVSTLDHYLPKANFPLLVVMPNNLIPSCGDCNKIKLDTFPSDAECQTLHPYYDDVSDAQWLFAEVIQTSPVSIRFLLILLLLGML